MLLLCLSLSVVFQFKSSKKSNNGTDVNAGQIPQLLYRHVKFSTFCPKWPKPYFTHTVINLFLLNIRLPSNDGNASKGKQQSSEPVHILKRSFARTVSVVSTVMIHHVTVTTSTFLQHGLTDIPLFVGVFWVSAEYPSLELDHAGFGCWGTSRAEGFPVHRHVAGPGETALCWHVLPPPAPGLHLWNFPHHR